MKALLLGRDGQVATEILRRAGAYGIKVEALEVPELDFTDPEGAAALVRAKECDIIINAAAYTAVDKAESEEKLAQLINADGPGAVAKVAAEKGIPFLHISTDYVFDGSGEGRFSTEDPTGPLGVYGATKLDGERQVAEAGGWHAILRTSWVFSAHGGNFVKTMLRLGAERDKLTIVADQVGGPTAAADIAEALLTIAKAGPEAEGGLFHFAGVPDASWADFAREIFAQAGVDCAVEDIPTSAYPTPAARPLNSRLDCSRLTRTHGIEPPDWNAALAEVLAELGATKPN
ncbi:dTDP-4-dehydrorhamnose reductase [Aliiruegeria lutimaris]|uniref:dTDP-4-dehydrorhamnose reductase n=1 Tax=Aliiruegeria lutimaris TaxID=571298 RepID=A0A1G8VYB6_9RHOB|nr:dTDP-4-dehydrorhamnose reductase [Aliiruegeria lutimaris]SDJ71094.1 dTDP-4-dehydrorhamnose reductase [Aliiruegeria lutimaris]